MSDDTADRPEPQARSLADAAFFRSENLQKILSILNEPPGEARVVGGAVRNALMGHEVGDIDIATTLLPDEVIERAKKAGIKAVATGIDHGTVTLVEAGRPFEVTTLRADVASNGRHAEVAFGVDWAEDARRRDLTINALYVDGDGAVVDHVGGLADIESGTVRFIGEAEERITEDYLRILRFFRFFAWYGRGRPDADGLKAAARLKEGLARLSSERVWSELKKLLSARDPSRALLWMRQSGVLNEVLPESEKWGIDAITGLIHAEEAFGWEPDPLLRLVAIIPPDAERIDAMAKRLRMSKGETARLRNWATTQPPRHDMGDMAFGKLLYRSHIGGVRDRLALALASARMRARSDKNALAEAAGQSRLMDRLARWERPVFPLSGDDLIEAGPTLGETRARLETAWIDSNFTLRRDDLLERAAAQQAERTEAATPEDETEI
jgi:poly(A) polymerase